MTQGKGFTRAESEPLTLNPFEWVNVGRSPKLSESYLSAAFHQVGQFPFDVHQAFLI
jgi:hypothetical protein